MERGFAFWVGIAGLCIALVGCSHGDTSWDTAPASGPRGWVTIETPASTSVACNRVYLEGEAFVSPTWSGCCGGTARVMTGVTVQWRNETTGQSGDARQSVETGWFWTHSWAAYILLAQGDNHIVVTASDPAGLTGNRSIVINQSTATYTVSGQFRNQNGVGLGYASGVTATLSGPSAATEYAPDASGYHFYCVQPGRYLLTPSPTFAMTFSPGTHSFDVIDRDVTLPDMLTTSYRVSGKVYSYWLDPEFVRVSDGTKQYGVWTDADESYAFMLPNGSYRIHCGLSGGIACSPGYRDVVVVDADQDGINFNH